MTRIPFNLKIEWLSENSKKCQKYQINGCYGGYCGAGDRHGLLDLWESARTLIFICYQPLQLFTLLLANYNLSRLMIVKPSHVLDFLSGFRDFFPV